MSARPLGALGLLTLLLGLAAGVMAQPGPGSVPGYLMVPNDVSTGTVQNQLAKIVQGKAVKATNTDTAIDLYVCAANCGTVGNAQLIVVGETYCVMDNAVTVAAGQNAPYIVISPDGTASGAPRCH